MIEVLYTEETPELRELLENLQRMSLAYNLVRLSEDDEGALRKLASGSWPVIRDGEKLVRGRNEIRTFLEELERFKQEWDKFQSDSCYCDENGEVE